MPLAVPKSPSELRNEVEKEIVQAVEPPRPEEIDDPRDQPEYTFRINHVDARGRAFKGEFTNKILSLGEKRMSRVMTVRMNGSVNPDAFHPVEVELTRAVAHMEFSLIKKPKWAENFDDLDSNGPLLAVWAEVASHEATFHRLGSNTDESTEES